MIQIVYIRIISRSYSFEVNLKSGSDTLLHFNPDVSKGAVVRNSKVDGEWDDDETDGGMPFQLGEIFNIHIIITEEEFVVRIYCIMISYLEFHILVIYCIYTVYI